MKTAKKVGQWGIVTLLVGCVAYLIGPSADFDYQPQKLPQVPFALNEVEAYVRSHEAATPFLKPDNEARIIWADSVPQKTKFVILYLPGYSGTYYEGEPLHKEIAERYHANLYLPRLHSHGVQPLEPFLDITAENYVQSAREALAVANQLGDSVILMSTSTGGTLSLILASEHHPKIAALVMFSPNIEIFFGAAKLLDKPWGLQIARLVYGGKYHEWKVYEDYIQNYWTTRYRLEGLVQLQALLSRTMVPETFHEVNKPVFLGYYYESESAQDSTVSVAAMKQMYKELATPESLKTQHAFGNAKAHVIACKKRSGAFAEVKQATTQFLDNILDK